MHVSGTPAGVAAMSGAGWASLHQVSHHLVVAPELLHVGTLSKRTKPKIANSLKAS